MNFSLSNRISQVLLLTAGLATPIMAQGLTQFTNGQTADANAVNANFSAVKNSADNAQATADAAQAAAATAQATATGAQSGLNALTGAITVVNGDVGIGTTSPTMPLDIAVDTKIGFAKKLFFSDPTTNGDEISFLRLTGANEESVLQLQIGDESSGFDRFNIRGAETKFSFYTNTGQAFKEGGGSWSVLSDARRKRDIRPLDGALTKLLRLEGKTYRYKDPTELGAAPGTCRGFIAQEVETVFPSWVAENAAGIKSLTITGFEALTVESLRELDQRNHDLQAENDDLRQRLESLEAAVAQLQPLLAARK